MRRGRGKARMVNIFFYQSDPSKIGRIGEESGLAKSTIM